MKTYQIHIQGQVQGVGFRPFVYQLAQRYDLSGWVSNRTDGVRVVVNATETVVDLFVEDLLTQHPAVAHITHHTRHTVPDQSFGEFIIVHSQEGEHPDVLLTPDIALCSACRAEMHDVADRRHEYAFTHCTHCGPRYSIMQALPYDRATTAMAPFALCPDCHQEYHSPADRRYYAQANSCPQCPITLSLYDQQQTLVSYEPKQVVALAAEALRAGSTVAVKGIGGYLLLCDAAQPTAIVTLRTRKQRPTKPLALLYPSLEMLQQDTALPADAQAALTGPVSPIVLLPLTAAVRERVASEQIAPGLDQFGVMLPYAPLLAGLMRAVARPLVATSGNASGSPILHDERERALASLSHLADYYLSHNRAIVVPQDDSVVRFSPTARQRIVLRRSRGMAPSYRQTQSWPTDECVLALGGHLKSTFAYIYRGNVFASQYLGHLESYNTQERYQQVLRHLLSIFDATPTVVLTDRHPQYFTNQYGQTLAHLYQSRLITVQHHEAHFAAVLGEHDLTDTDETILGVVWDGTGLGDDGQIWGGEFFTYQSYAFQRVDHLPYFRHLMGDKMAREPRLSALSLLAIVGKEALLQDKFTDPEWQYYWRQVHQPEGLCISSVGRLFDAVACLLGLADRTTYEGEAALYLETLANRYVQQHGYDELYSYFSYEEPSVISTDSLVVGILSDLARVSPEKIAACFHYSLAQLIHTVAQRSGTTQIAFSGGVFQNALLVDMIHAQMGGDYHLYFHQQLSPNDENIAFGQLMHYQIQQKAQKKSSSYVISSKLAINQDRKNEVLL